MEHAVIATVHDAAVRVIDHPDHVHDTMWRRLFQFPREPHLVDRTRDFIAAVDSLLEVSITQMTSRDLAAISADIEGVISRLEKRISALSEPADARPLIQAIYVLRLRFEKLVHRSSQKVSAGGLLSATPDKTR